MFRPGRRRHASHSGDTLDDPIVAELRATIGHDSVRVDAAERSLLSRDASVFRGGVAGPVCFPASTADVQAIVRIAARQGRSVVPRGAGTGLAGGAIPLGAPVVVALTRMNRILEVDLDNRVAWVEPGVVNLDLTKHLASHGFHFAPDPSSQQVCTIGGNVANNSGGPHCLADGVTNAHVKAIEVVLPDGEVALLGGLDAEPLGLDLHGVFIGGEGTLGIATRIAVTITKSRPAVRTMLLSFDHMNDAANTVSAVIASGVVPAAMEVMDQRITQAVEHYVHAGFPIDATAVLLAEVDGLEAGVEIDAEAIATIARQHGATAVRLAASDAERQLLWKGRKTAFGAIAQIAPDYYLHDTVVPRAKLAEVLAQIYEIAERHDLIVMNVFHAGDGNLHPLLLFDGHEPGVLDRVHAAGAEIITASLDAGGVLSGEHGIGVEKQAYMSRLFTDDDLDHQERLRRAFDPTCRTNPGKVLPIGHSCADIQALRQRADRCVGMTATLTDHDSTLLAFADEVGTDGSIAVRGGGTRWHLGGASTAGTRLIAAPGGIVTYQPEEMTVRVHAGTTVAELHAAFREHGQRTALVEHGGTVGGAVVVGENGVHTLGRGTLRSSVLQIRYVSADGRVVNGGGPTVKNVTGFDLPRLFVGSLGTLGLLAEVILRTNPIPAASVWLAADDADPFAAFDALQRPSSVLWNGDRTWVLLEGHGADIDAERAVLARHGTFTEVAGPPTPPSCRWSLPPADLRALPAGPDGRDFVAVIGVGLAFCDTPQPQRTVDAPIRSLHQRMKTNFDPTGRLNPGRDPLAR